MLKKYVLNKWINEQMKYFSLECLSSPIYEYRKHMDTDGSESLLLKLS